jgi:hypothetical protein
MPVYERPFPELVDLRDLETTLYKVIRNQRGGPLEGSRIHQAALALADELSSLVVSVHLSNRQKTVPPPDSGIPPYWPVPDSSIDWL